MAAQVWAHRGASGYAPENTLESFALAAEQGADAIELDVQLSRDGELVVIPDETTDRDASFEKSARPSGRKGRRPADFKKDKEGGKEGEEDARGREGRAGAPLPFRSRGSAIFSLSLVSCLTSESGNE